MPLRPICLPHRRLLSAAARPLARTRPPQLPGPGALFPNGYHGYRWPEGVRHRHRHAARAHALVISWPICHPCITSKLRPPPVLPVRLDRRWLRPTRLTLAIYTTERKRLAAWIWSQGKTWIESAVLFNNTRIGSTVTFDNTRIGTTVYFNVILITNSCFLKMTYPGIGYHIVTS